MENLESRNKFIEYLINNLPHVANSINSLVNNLKSIATDEISNSGIDFKKVVKD